MSIQDKIKEQLLSENYQKLDNLFEELELHFNFTDEQANAIIKALNTAKAELYKITKESKLK